MSAGLIKEVGEDERVGRECQVTEAGGKGGKREWLDE